VAASAGTISVPGGTTTLTANASGGSQPYSYSLDGVAYQSGNTFTVGAGTYVVTAMDNNGCTGISNSVTVEEPSTGFTPSYVFYFGNRSATYGTYANLSALLLDNWFRPLRNREVTFTIGTQSVSAYTNSRGFAYATLLVTQTPGDYRVVTSFAGDAVYRPATDNDPFRINPNYLTINLTGSVVKPYDGTTTAYLSEDNFVLSGVVNGDDISLNIPQTGTYDNHNVGSRKRVTVTGLELTGTNSDRYILINTSASSRIGIIKSGNGDNGAVTGVAPEFKLIEQKVYPNPFSDKLRFEFVSPLATHAKIDIYDMTGRMVETVFDNYVEAGVNYNVEFKPATIISATYVYHMTIGGVVYTGKVIYKKE
jgi:hypothetical protein